MKKISAIIPFFIVWLTVYSSEVLAVPPSNAEYTCSPIFMARNVKPNILIILDSSANMSLQAYTGDFNPAITYYGYFNPTLQYAYSSNKFSISASGQWNGNFLNWLSMRRIDVALKVLVGGKAESRTGGGVQVLVGANAIPAGSGYFKFCANSSSYSPYTGTGPNPYEFFIDNGYIKIYRWESEQWKEQKGSDLPYTIKVQKDPAYEPNDFGPDGNIAGVMQRIGDVKARFGLEFYNRGDGVDAGNDKRYDGGNVRSSIGSNMTNMITNIENLHSADWAPMAEAFYEGVRYFQQVAPAYGNDYTVNQNNDPYYFSDEAGYVPCGKSFVLLLTSGESSMDRNIPTTYQDYDNDGKDPGSYLNNGSDYLDDVALWAHTNDMRSDLDGTQVITLYTVFAFGRGSALLKDASTNGGFIDKNGNNIPDQQNEWDENGDGVPDTYFEAEDGNELEVQLLAAITDILRRAASGTAVSVLATSAEGEGSLFQAFFRPVVLEPDLREIQWVGYLLSLWIDPNGNLREDTDGDKRLVYPRDKIIKYIFDSSTGDTMIGRFSDSNGDGEPDSTTPDSTIALDDLQSLWEAGKLLALRQPSDRTIYTFIDINKNNTVDTGENISFTTSNASALRPFLRASTSTEAENIINFIRGSTITGYRDRVVSVEGENKVWKLGDIVYSTPTVMSKPMNDYTLIYGDESFDLFYNTYKNRDVVVFVGGNDGMIHAFKAGTFNAGDDATTADIEHGRFTGTNLGSELWAYAPYNLLPHLKWLTQTTYAHVYYVDLKPRIIDAKIFTPDSTHPEGWGSVLIGGMRLGGGPIPVTDNFGTGNETRTFRSAYFAIDVTNPSSPVPLWEYTDSNLGATLSYPTVAKVGNSWFLLFGSGPNFFCETTSTQTSRLYILNLKTGQLLKTFTGGANAFMGSPISVDVFLDYDVEVCYVGETYKDGTVWKGRMYRLTTKTCSLNCSDPLNWHVNEDPTTWTFSTLFQLDQPVTAPPSVSLDDQGKLWVYFGTGRYFSEADKTDSSLQRFYGIIDPCIHGGCTDTISISNLLDASLATVSTGGSVSGISGVTDWTSLLSTVKGKDGWYLNLTTSGERTLSKPSVLGGIVLFTTFIPNNYICSFGGTGKLYALFYTTGTAYKRSVIGTEGDVIKKSMDLGVGVPSSLGIHVGQEEGGKGYVQQSTGTIQEIDVNPAFKIKGGTMSWREK
jgi:type IV pilus assembly protein PilY1